MELTHRGAVETSDAPMIRAHNVEAFAELAEQADLSLRDVAALAQRNQLGLAVRRVQLRRKQRQLEEHRHHPATPATDGPAGRLLLMAKRLAWSGDVRALEGLARRR